MWRINVRQLSTGACYVLREIALLGQVVLGEAIVKGIVKKVTVDEGVCFDRMSRKNVIES